MRLPRPLLPLLLLAAALPACSDTYEFDEGPICLADPDLPMSFEPGDDLEFTVILDPCMTCADSFGATCDVTIDGDRLIVDARGSYIRKRAAACEDICLELAAKCVVRDLQPGTYTLESGANQISVALPSATPFQQDAACAP